MSGIERISPEEIDRIKLRADLVGMISARVALKREGGEYAGLCPFHNETTASFTVVPKKGFYHCFGCGAHGDAITWLQEMEGLSFAEALRKLGGEAVAARKDFIPASAQVVKDRAAEEAEQKKKIERAREIWGQSRPADGTLVETYLATRGLSGLMIPPTLRFHPSLWSQEASDRLPAMIGLVFAQNRIVAVHRTYLRPDGKGKAQLDKPKKILGPFRGGHVQLDALGGKRLFVAEGIETALSVKKARPWISIWAALSLNNMGAPVPKNVKELILCADGDNKDQKSAEAHLTKAVSAHFQEGRVIRIMRPDAGKDFNDMLRGSV